ncbi:MAG: hypothetical protein DKT66_22885 [Candidatus Melainabacteria bacterium]|nr:MAG: hypothetical protein DKT66_22885 [Candidatus Melainabacteria bacterium]
MRFILSLCVLLGVTFVFLSSNSAFAETDGIGWIPTWKQAISEASKAHKPILLVAAAPQCAGVSGIW